MNLVSTDAMTTSILIGQEDNCAAILELNKSLGYADVIFIAELASVKPSKKPENQKGF